MSLELLLPLLEFPSGVYPARVAQMLKAIAPQIEQFYTSHWDSKRWADVAGIDHKIRRIRIKANPYMTRLKVKMDSRDFELAQDPRSRMDAYIVTRRIFKPSPRQLNPNPHFGLEQIRSGATYNNYVSLPTALRFSVPPITPEQVTRFNRFFSVHIILSLFCPFEDWPHKDLHQIWAAYHKNPRASDSAKLDLQLPEAVVGELLLLVLVLANCPLDNLPKLGRVAEKLKIPLDEQGTYAHSPNKLTLLCIDAAINLTRINLDLAEHLTQDSDTLQLMLKIRQAFVDKVEITD